MKITKSTFFGQSSEGIWIWEGGGVQANLLGSRGSPSVNPASENPVIGVNIF